MLHKHLQWFAVAAVCVTVSAGYWEMWTQHALRQVRQQHLQPWVRIPTPMQCLSTHSSLQQLPPVTLSQQLPKNDAAQCSPCCSELSTFGHAAAFSIKRDCRGRWPPLDLVWAILGKRPNAMGQAIDLWGMQGWLLKEF